MNARTAEEQRALEVPPLPMPLEDFQRELGDLELWRQEICDRHPGLRSFDFPAPEAADYQRLDRVIAQLSTGLIT